MLSQDSEDEIRSRFVFEIVIWPQEVTLARWTQPSGPLCLWQCLLLRLRYSTSDPQKIFLRHGTLWHSSFGCHKCSNQGNWGYRCCCGSRWTHSWLIWKKRILKRRKNQLWSLLAHLSKNVWQIQYGAYAMFICDLKVQRKWWKGKGNSVGKWLQNQI